MFTHMHLVRQEQFTARGSTYELALYRVAETGDRSLFVSKVGKGVGHSFFASSDVVADAKIQSGVDVEQALFDQAKDDITRNEFGEYWCLASRSSGR